MEHPKLKTSTVILASVIFLFFVVSIYYYFITTVTGDIIVFLGSSHLADIQYGGGIQGAILSWELKPFANRIFIYFIYELARIFVSFENKDSFILAVKAINSILVIISSLCFTKVVQNKYRFSRSQSFFVLFLVSGLIFLYTFRSVLQPEYTCFLISLISLFFLLSNRRAYIILGILLLSIMPFFKGISLIFSIQVIVLLWGVFKIKKNKLLFISTGFVVICALIILLFYFVYPQEFVNLIDATLFQSTFELTITGFIKAIREVGSRFQLNFVFYPFLPLAVIGLIFYVADKKKIMERNILSIIATWIIGIGAIAIQHLYFVYHYANLSIPLIFSVFLLCEVKPEIRNKSMTINMLGTCCFIILLFLVSSPLQTAINYALPDTKELRYISDWSYLSITKQKDNCKRMIDFSQTLDREQNILYLDSGTGAWCFGMKSASKYFFPLPVQRSNTNPKLVNTEAYKELLKQINTYDGKYIFIDTGWFNIADENFSGFKKILSSYEKFVFTGTKLEFYTSK